MYNEVELSRSYWWLVGKNEGKTFLIFGSDKSEEDARQHGFEMLGGVDFQIRRLPTKNISEASRQLKGNILEKTKDIGAATRRLKHKRINKGRITL